MSSLEYFKEYRKKNHDLILEKDRKRYQTKNNTSPRPRYFSRKLLGEKQYNKQYYANVRKDIQKSKYESLKIKFFEMYGNKCNCCGESVLEFLTVEHINGLQGKARKSGVTLYKEVTDEYRPDLYEVLCMNCNHARMRIGYCPHKRS